MKTNSIPGSLLNPTQTLPTALRRGGNTAPCLIILLLALVLWPGSAFAQGTNGILLTTFTNPIPAASDIFGEPVAAVGSGLVLIADRGESTGAVSAGAAYLFSTDGTLVTTITNPTPADYDAFGWSVAALGSDRLLIGAPFD